MATERRGCDYLACQNIHADFLMKFRPHPPPAGAPIPFPSTKNDRLSDGRMLAGDVGEEALVLVRRGDDFFAVDAACTHYGGPLAEGLLVGDTVRCPWHHACFSLKTGEALDAPAFSPLACWKVERRDDRIFVEYKQELLEPHRAAGAAPAGSPAKIVIVGGGAA